MFRRFLVPLHLLLLSIAVSTTGAVRMITQEELQKHNGVDSEQIWLALLGKVFNVTVGADHYGPGSAYHIFAGRDAPVPFVTGKFDEEEAQRPWRDLVEKKALGSLQEWITFYAEGKDDKKYELIGYMEGPFYSSDGTPTPETLEFDKLVQEEEAYYKEKRKRDKAERDRKRKEREDKKKTSEL